MADPDLHVVATEMQYRTRDYPVDWRVNQDGSVSIQIEHGVQLYGFSPGAPERLAERLPAGSLVERAATTNQTTLPPHAVPYRCVYKLAFQPKPHRRCGKKWQLL